MPKRSANVFANMDWITVLLVLALMLIGWFNIYAAVYNEEFTDIFSFSQRYGKQFIWICAAVLLGFFIMLLDTRYFTLFAYPFYAICLMALVLVLLVGVEVNGAKGWFSFGGFQLQPAEFAKLGTALALAKFLGAERGSVMRINNFLPEMGIVFAPPMLIILQPDAGSCLVYLAFLLALYREGFSQGLVVFGFSVVLLFLLSIWLQDYYPLLILCVILFGFLVFWLQSQNHRLLFKAVIVFVVSLFVCWLADYLIIKKIPLELILLIAFFISFLVYLAFALHQRIKFIRNLAVFIMASLFFTISVDFVFEKVLSEHQRQRILVMMGKKSDPLGIEYNVNQSKIAIGSGGVAGKGFLEGTQTKFNFVPEQSTDFIFCTVGEEWGFVGTSIVILLYGFLLFRIQRLAERQRSLFSRVYGYSVLFILLEHVVINISMTIGLFPVVGIPLPFMSYGGSSLWMFTILLMILIRLDASRDEYLV